MSQDDNERKKNHLGAKVANQIRVRTQSAFINKLSLALLNELFPRGSAQCVLEISDTFMISVTKQVPEDAVVRDTKLATVVPIRDMNDLDAVGENGKAVRIKEP